MTTLRAAIVSASKSFMPTWAKHMADSLTADQIDQFLNILNAQGVYAVKSGDADRAGVVPLAANDSIDVSRPDQPETF